MPVSVEHSTFIRAKPESLYVRLASGPGWEKWFATEASIGNELGKPIFFRWENFGATRYTAEDRGHVIALEEGRTLSFTWHPGKTETLVSFNFEPRGDGCILSVKETGYSNSEDDVSTALSVASGWGEALTLLKFFVERDIVYGSVPD